VIHKNHTMKIDPVTNKKEVKKQFGYALALIQILNGLGRGPRRSPGKMFLKGEEARKGVLPGEPNLFYKGGGTAQKRRFNEKGNAS